MTDLDKGFWRGFWPLLLALGAAQLTQQLDIVMVGRLGGGASAAYVLLTRLAIVDVVSMAAIGAVASTAVARAERSGETTRAIAQSLGLATLAGLCCCALGLSFYSRAAEWLAGDAEITRLIGASVVSYAFAIPLRFFANTSAFVLHALGHGAAVVRWKLLEAAAKAVLNLLLMQVFGWGLPGCFVSGLIVAGLTSIWCWRMLSPHGVRCIAIPEYSWAVQFLRSTAWEAQRMICVQLAVLLSLALFAAPWLGRYELSRVNAYAAGQMLMLILFTPFVTLMRFLAFRLPKLPDGDVAALIRRLWLRGLPIVAPIAAVLFSCRDWLGDLYGQQGPWWSLLIQALAVSLPVRYATNVLRAVLQAQGAFGAVAAADGATVWSCAVPLVALGLYVDAPMIAYLSLILPEAVCAAWLWRRLHGSNLLAKAQVHGKRPRQSPTATIPGCAPDRGVADAHDFERR